MIPHAPELLAAIAACVAVAWAYKFGTWAEERRAIRDRSAQAEAQRTEGARHREVCEGAMAANARLTSELDQAHAQTEALAATLERERAQHRDTAQQLGGAAMALIWIRPDLERTRAEVARLLRELAPYRSGGKKVRAVRG